METLENIFCFEQLSNHIIGSIISMLIAGTYFIIKRYIARIHKKCPKEKRMLIIEVNQQILDHLYYLLDNNELVSKNIITKIRYAYAVNYQLRPKEVIKQDEIWAKMLIHITASTIFSTEEKIDMTKHICSNADYYHYAMVKKIIFYLICSLIVFSILYAVMHIEYVCERTQQIFYPYSEFIILFLVITFSIIISHYIYLTYVQYSSSK